MPVGSNILRPEEGENVDSLLCALGLIFLDFKDVVILLAS
ncbi:glutamine phosphoribosylpyrophosphate amidotransferase [Paenibacillus popilliae ATCC 14706]|uniref:Glutamine phosphoribosylpyrophosphate amidotransferase n=1 Tax=Paenibacillus popilliae ATCC 14706 TaxID=1212764 RepID=M9L9B8_PAEPP|nr:glutamine phosphoribosylpyrophosphate amidotransferase [Paenibacillus popilliae ATCC 14706]